MNRRDVLFGAVAILAGLGGSLRAQAPAGSEVNAVSYVEVVPSARTAMVGALTRYRDVSIKEDGYVHIDVLEQIGRPAHFAIIERWRDQKAFDVHGTAAHVKQFRDAFQSMRVSGYDERPYRTLTSGSSVAGGGGRPVYVVAHVDIGGGGPSDAPGLLRRLAEESRRDEGCLRFDVLQHAMRLNHFTVIEAWRNQAALDAHAATPHTKAYRDALQPISGSPLDERLYTAVE